MGEIKIIGTDETHGYPFLTCETEFVLILAVLENSA